MYKLINNSVGEKIVVLKIGFLDWNRAVLRILQPHYACQVCVTAEDQHYADNRRGNRKKPNSPCLQEATSQRKHLKMTSSCCGTAVASAIFHIYVPAQVLATSLEIQLLANPPAKAVADDLRTCALSPCRRRGWSSGLLASASPKPDEYLASEFAYGRSINQSLSFSLSHCLSNRSFKCKWKGKII